MGFGLVPDPATNLIVGKNYKIVSKTNPDIVYTGTLIEKYSNYVRVRRDLPNLYFPDEGILEFTISSYDFYGEYQSGGRRNRRRTTRRRQTRRHSRTPKKLGRSLYR